MDRQPHRIVVEGMDGAGKTTLIEQLSNDFPQFQVITRPQGRSFNDWWPEELDRLAGEPSTRSWSTDPSFDTRSTPIRLF